MCLSACLTSLCLYAASTAEATNDLEFVGMNTAKAAAKVADDTTGCMAYIFSAFDRIIMLWWVETRGSDQAHARFKAKQIEELDFSFLTGPGIELDFFALSIFLSIYEENGSRLAKLEFSIIL